jgi:hypothetical protein
VAAAQYRSKNKVEPMMPTTKIHLQLDDGWSIMQMLSNTSAIAIYWVTHEHPEREETWRYVDLKRCPKTSKMKCIFCNKVAPTEALGFCNMLEGEMVYDEVRRK